MDGYQVRENTVVVRGKAHHHDEFRALIENTDRAELVSSERTGEPATGHAAVGLVRDTRFEDGGRPEFVAMLYRPCDTADVSTAIVERESDGQQVADPPGETVKFWRPNGEVLWVDAVLSAWPVEVPDRLAEVLV